MFKTIGGILVVFFVTFIFWIIPIKILAVDYIESCNATALTEAGYGTGDTLTLQDGGDGICILDASLTIGVLTIENGATLTHVAQDTDGITISATNIDINLGGLLSADGQGCSGGAPSADGYGPDLTTGVCTITTSGYGDSALGGSGAGHGGEGGRAYANTPGALYDANTLPILLGAGGGGGTTASASGGGGGGLIHLVITDTLTVNGVITADGTAGTAYLTRAGGAGAGGAIQITAITITGTGSIGANGANGGDATAYDGGGGGGGRVAVYYADTSGFSLNNISASKGLKGGINGSAADGEDGTVYTVCTLPDQPSVSSPTNASYNASQNPTLVGTSYVAASLAHTVTDWKITTDVGGENVVWFGYDDAVNLESTTINETNGEFINDLENASQLSANTTYYAFVRYANSAGDSVWSNAISFTTLYTGTVTTQTWNFNEDVPANVYTYDDAVIDVNSTGNSLTRLIDLGGGVYTATAPVSYPGWSKRKTITVQNNVASDLTNYQVRIAVTYDADMQADFTDIRFTDIDKTTPLDYWLETKINSTSAVFWVEVPTVPASGTAIIYMYYGKSGVSSASNISDTFLFGDDFSSASLDNSWTEVTRGGGILGTLASGAWTKQCISSGICDWWTNSDLRAGIYVSDPGQDTGMAWEAVTYMSDASIYASRQIGMLLFHALREGYAWGYFNNGTAYFRVEKMGIASVCRVDSGTVPIYLKIRKSTSNLPAETNTFSFYRSTTSTGSWTQCLTYTTDDIMENVGLMVQDYALDVNTSYGTFDYFFIKKYAATEPTANTFGTEENLLFNADVSLKPSATGAHPYINQLYGFSETLGVENTGNTRYQIGLDTNADNTVDGWYYVNGTTWTAVGNDDEDNNSATTINEFLPKFTSDVGTGNIYFKVFLNSTGGQAVNLDSISLTYGYNIANTPSITAPENNLTDVNNNPALTSSAYVSDGAVHLTSDWKITTDPGGDTVVWSKDDDAVNLTSTIVNATNGIFSGALSGRTQLDYVTQYFVFVRYDNSAGASNWSATSSFTTMANTPPAMSGVQIDSGAVSISLIENSTKAVTVIGTATDNEGCSTLTGVNAVFYRSTVGAEAADDFNDHYSSTCTQDEGSCTGGADTTATYTCTLNIQYYADPTNEGSIYATDNWVTFLTPSDLAGEGNADSDTIEMNTLTAVSVNASMSFGEIALGANTGASNQNSIITNTGNEGLDANVAGYGGSPADGYAMICTIGTIPVANEKYSVTAFDYSLAGTALAGSNTTLDLNIPQRTGEVSSSLLYWGLGVPSTGVGGSCNGTIVISAVSDPNLE